MILLFLIFIPFFLCLDKSSELLILVWFDVFSGRVEELRLRKSRKNLLYTQRRDDDCFFMIWTYLWKIISYFFSRDPMEDHSIYCHSCRSYRMPFDWFSCRPNRRRHCQRAMVIWFALRMLLCAMPNHVVPQNCLALLQWHFSFLVFVPTMS